MTAPTVSQHHLVLRLHQKVNVVVLDAVVDEAEVVALAGLAEAPPQLGDEPPAAQPRQPVPKAQGDVHRLAAPKALAPLLVPIEKKKRMADFVIDNSGTPEETERQVRALYATLTKR